MEATLKLQKLDENEAEKSQSSYQPAVGWLIYLMTDTRPDWSFAVSLLNQFMRKPGEEQLGGFKTISQIFEWFLFNWFVLFGFITEASCSYCFTDANCGNDINDRISTSGFVFFIGNCCVSWKSHKQRCVARSTTEADYVALSECVQEAIWLRRLLSERGFQQTEQTKIYEDNRGAIELAKNPTLHKR